MLTNLLSKRSQVKPNTAGIAPNAEVDIVGNMLGADPWDRVRESNVGGLLAIQNANAPAEDPVWEAQPRAAGHRLTQVNLDGATFPIQHDESGRLTRGLDYDFIHDPLAGRTGGRLAAASNTTGVAEIYLYDADGRLAHVARPPSTEAESYVYDGDNMIAAYDEQGSPLWEAVWGPKQDQLVEFHDFGTDVWHSVLRDHRNSPVATWNTDQFYVEETATYTAEGRLEVFAHDGTSACREVGSATTICLGPANMPFAFNSMWRSPLTGLSFMRARWYSPRLAQFTTHDPLEFADLYTLYGFAAYDPINGWDPFGRIASMFAKAQAACDGDPSCLGGVANVKETHERRQAEQENAEIIRGRLKAPRVKTNRNPGCHGASCDFTKQHLDMAIDIAIQETISTAVGGPLAKAATILLGRGISLSMRAWNRLPAKGKAEILDALVDGSDDVARLLVQTAEDAAGGLSPRATRRQVMREAGIPTSQQPVAQTSVRAPGNQLAGRQYTYHVPAEDGGTRTASVQHSLTDRLSGHGPHWEAGYVKDTGQTDSLGRPRLTSDKVKIDE